MIFNEIIKSANELMCPFCKDNLHIGKPNILTGISIYDIYLCKYCSFECCKDVEFNIRWLYRGTICGISWYSQYRNLMAFHYWIGDSNLIHHIIDNNHMNYIKNYSVVTLEDLNNVLDKFIKIQIFE